MATFMFLVFSALIGLVVVFAINRVVGAGKAAGRAAGRAVTRKPPPTTATSVNLEEEIAKLRGMGTRSANISTVDATRHELQRMAYLVQRDRPDLTAEFTELMNNFMDIDPQYEQGLAVALPLIAAQPGIRQTALYQPMRMDAEDCRRVLYFAESKGRIVRVKKGNSYQLYLPGHAQG
ncbi:MAG: hypothetical protein K2X65_07505 [Burkholderiaceae bacterium]|nr:hypothetical protein [Burkholderiaceae bacterium]